MSTRNKLKKGCGWASALGAIGAGAVMYFWVDFPIAAMQFGAAEERARKAGVPLTLQDLGITPPAQPAPPSAISRHAAAFQEVDSSMFEALEDPAQGPEEVLRIAERVSSQAEEVYQQTKLPYRPQLDYDLGLDMVFARFSDMRQAAKFFSYRSTAYARVGQAEQAARDLATIRRIAAQTGEYSTLLSALVANAIEAIALGATRRAAAAFGQSPEALALLEEELAGSGEMPVDLDRVLRGEAYFIISHIRNLDVHTSMHPWAALLMKQLPPELPEEADLAEEPPVPQVDVARIRRSGPPPGWVLRGSMTRVLEAWAAYFEAIPKTGSTLEHHKEGIRRMEQVLGNRRLSYSMVRDSVPLPSILSIIQLSTRADYLTARAYVDVLQFRNQHGRWPESLAEAGVEAIDPFDDKPFRYRLEGEGFRIWSVGFDGRDDGGTFPLDRIAVYPIVRPAGTPRPLQP